MSNVRRRTIASVLAIPLAIGVVAIVRARATSPASPKAAAPPSSLNTTTSAGNSVSPGNVATLGRLLVVSPDGAGAGLPTYTAAGAVAQSSSSWINHTYPSQASATQSSSDPASNY